MLFNIETAESFSVRSRFLYKDIVADTLVERANVNCLFGLGILEFKNPNAKYSLEERLSNFLMSKHHCKHEPVRNGELFKRNAFCIHFFHLATETRRFSRIENRPYLYYTRNFQTLNAVFFEKFISFYEIGRKYFDCLEGFAELKYIRVIQQKGGHQTA